jgi:hypothetical protein
MGPSTLSRRLTASGVRPEYCTRDNKADTSPGDLQGGGWREGR